MRHRVHASSGRCQWSGSGDARTGSLPARSAARSSTRGEAAAVHGRSRVTSLQRKEPPGAVDRPLDVQHRLRRRPDPLHVQDQLPESPQVRRRQTWLLHARGGHHALFDPAAAVDDHRDRLGARSRLPDSSVTPVHAIEVAGHAAVHQRLTQPPRRGNDETLFRFRRCARAAAGSATERHAGHRGVHQFLHDHGHVGVIESFRDRDRRCRLGRATEPAAGDRRTPIVQHGLHGGGRPQTAPTAEDRLRQGAIAAYAQRRGPQAGRRTAGTVLDPCRGADGQRCRQSRSSLRNPIPGSRRQP